MPVQEGGWFATGDLGALDEDGYLTITGRKKDIVITSGSKNVTPAPLEDWLRAHPQPSRAPVMRSSGGQRWRVLTGWSVLRQGRTRTYGC